MTGYRPRLRDLALGIGPTTDAPTARRGDAIAATVPPDGGDRLLPLARRVGVHEHQAATSSPAACN
ncbi:hypothetical protein ACFRCW_40745 [Streptomyces sp. NPDC056653]|uniref:hypothetical protein n=1 Tax=Streptomyces sp. NPDC056653 TaxID=3345894 RepID=UPI00368E5A6F